MPLMYSVERKNAWRAPRPAFPRRRGSNAAAKPAVSWESDRTFYLAWRE